MSGYHLAGTQLIESEGFVLLGEAVFRLGRSGLLLLFLARDALGGLLVLARRLLTRSRNSSRVDVAGRAVVW